MSTSFTKSQIELLVNTRLKHSPLFNTRNSIALCKAWDTVCNELNFDQSKANIRRKFSNLLDSYKKAKRDNRQFEWAYLFDDMNDQVKLLEESENDSYKKMKRSKKLKQYDEKESEENNRDESKIENRESDERNERIESEIENRESEENKKDTKSVDHDRVTSKIKIIDESKTKTKKRDLNKNHTNSSFSQRPTEKDDSESQQFFTQPVNVYEKAMNDNESVETDKSYTSNIDNYNGLVPRVNIDSMSNYDEKYNEIVSSDDGKEEEKRKDRSESDNKKSVVEPKEMSKQSTSEVNLDGLSNEERIKFMDFYNKMKKKEKSKDSKIDDNNAEKKKKKSKDKVKNSEDSMKKENILERKDAQNNHSKYKEFGKTNKQETNEMQKDVNKIVDPAIESKKLSDEKVLVKKEKRKELSESKQSSNGSKMFKTNSTIKKDNEKKSDGKKSIGKESTGNMSTGKNGNVKKSDITYFENEKADNLLTSINKLNENITLLIEIFKNKK